MPEESTIPTHPYWDVFPKLVRVSTSEWPQTIPLSIRGSVESPVFESSNNDVVVVDEAGNVICGMQPGAAVVMVWHSDDRLSVRHVQVEVYGTPMGGGEMPS
jgi:photosystem II stability/assembly factor-like uncharacterized protein